jgi:peptidoglycan/LPS O-acetylase OafA/YrhL
LPSNAGQALSQDRIPAFDGLRGAAVLAVLLHHLSDYCPDTSGLKVILRGGWCGVDLFFVLSGFLITGILLDTRHSPNYFRAFYVRRILRIFPVYYLTLTGILFAAHFIPALTSVLPPPHDRVFYFFYLNNWWGLLRGGWHFNVIGHFWSLAVEEQFYLVWPFVVWRLSQKRMQALALCGILLAPVLRIAVDATYGAVRDIVENPFCRMDSLLMGALLASLVRTQRTGKKWQPALHLLAITFGIAIIAGGFSDVLLLKIVHSPLLISSGLAVVFGGLVSWTFLNKNVETSAQKVLRSPALTFCGKYSYGIYVYHVPLLWLVARYYLSLKPANSLFSFLLLTCGVILLTIALAKLSFDYFELYFLKWKANFVAAPVKIPESAY